MRARGKFSCQASSLIAVAAVVVLLFLVFSSQRGPGEIVVERTVSIGISSGPGSIDFGEIPAGPNYARREISLANLEAAPASVYLSAEGGISPHVSFERNGFVLGGG